ncbi:MAG: hypothetical protein JWN03_6094 [Nocardia sp.]|nr:hypothetical protein [Nocardia sp.]
MSDMPIAFSRHSGALLAGIYAVAVDPGQKHAGMTRGFMPG